MITLILFLIYQNQMSETDYIIVNRMLDKLIEITNNPIYKGPSNFDRKLDLMLKTIEAARSLTGNKNK